MNTPSNRFAVSCACLLPVVIAFAAISYRPSTEPHRTQADSTSLGEIGSKDESLKVHYLEIVTPSVDKTCDALEKAHGVTFGDPIAELGNARTAELRGGGRIGVRAPMRETEEPVVRPYVLVDDINAALKAVRMAGGEVAMTATEIPGQGTFAIYVLGGIDHGLWQL